MVARHAAPRQVVVSAAILVMLAGCAATPMGPTVQVMPGPGRSFEVFQADLAGCKYFAEEQVRGQAESANQRAAGGAVLTTVLGAGLGAAIGGAAGNAGAGAAIGAATGAGGGALYGANASTGAQYSIQQQYDNAFSQCMYAKGHQVPGFAPIVNYNSAPGGSVSGGSAPASALGLVSAPDPLVRATQSELIRLGYLRDSADGYIGPRTRAAIAGFQQANGLPADGSPSPRLLATLQATPSGANSGAPAGWVTPTRP
jgi:hypothetical protein